MGSLFSPPKPQRNQALEAEQAAAARRSAEEAEAERRRQEEERRAQSLGLRGRRSLLSTAGEEGFATGTTLGGV